MSIAKRVNAKSTHEAEKLLRASHYKEYLSYVVEERDLLRARGATDAHTLNNAAYHAATKRLRERYEGEYQRYLHAARDHFYSALA